MNTIINEQLIGLNHLRISKFMRSRKNFHLTVIFHLFFSSFKGSFNDKLTGSYKQAVNKLCLTKTNLYVKWLKMVY